MYITSYADCGLEHWQQIIFEQLWSESGTAFDATSIVNGLESLVLASAFCRLELPIENKVIHIKKTKVQYWFSI